jgi:hypothetical protein
MDKLPCGCTPDASGYGYCGECTRELRQKIWREMDENKKNYDIEYTITDEIKVSECINKYMKQGAKEAIKHIREVWDAHSQAITDHINNMDSPIYREMFNLIFKDFIKAIKETVEEADGK